VLGLTSQLHVAPKLRMSGVIPLLHQYAFMAWTETTLLVRVKPMFWLLFRDFALYWHSNVKVLGSNVTALFAKHTRLQARWFSKYATYFHKI
jgi:hypothetical protein